MPKVSTVRKANILTDFGPRALKAQMVWMVVGALVVVVVAVVADRIVLSAIMAQEMVVAAAVAEARAELVEPVVMEGVLLLEFISMLAASTEA